jgi:hypothetical protein
MEQNPIGFPNSMYFYVGPYTPYFSSSYKGIRGVPTMWPLTSNHLTNPMISLKLVSRIVQVGIITDHGEPLDE